MLHWILPLWQVVSGSGTPDHIFMFDASFAVVYNCGLHRVISLGSSDNWVCNAAKC